MVLKLEEVNQYNLPITKFTTKLRLMKQIQKNEKLARYFPDDIRSQADKPFVIDVVNTLDPSYFPTCASEIDGHMEKKAKVKEDVIELSPEMHNLICKLQNLPSNRKFNSHGQKLRIAKKKRKRPEVMPTPQLSTTIKDTGTVIKTHELGSKRFRGNK